MRSEDRITALPDCIVLHILSLVPFKSVVRASTLSKRWTTLCSALWAYSSTLDFGERFADGQTPDSIASNIDRILQIHGDNQIQKFRLYFYPGCNEKHERDLEKWIRLATGKGVQELHLDLSQGFPRRPVDSDYLVDGFADPRKPPRLPFIIFNCTPLAQLRLSLCRLLPPFQSDRLTSLRSLYFRQVDINDEALCNLLLNCQHLQALTLRECDNLSTIQISSRALLSLTVVDCSEASSVEIEAPSLVSLQFYGDLIGISLDEVSALVDAFVSTYNRLGNEPEMDWSFVECLTHVKILTLCNATLVDFIVRERFAPDNYPMVFPNLQELQLLIEYEPYTEDILGFFGLSHCPRLERLFIRLPTTLEEQRSNIPLQTPLECVFHQLKMIKIEGFQGREDQIHLVNFFLEMAVSLETMLLVAPAREEMEMMPNASTSTSTHQSQSSDAIQLLDISEKLMFLKETFVNTRIVFCKHPEDDSVLPSPTHTELYHEM